MDIKELDKKQLILLTLLITFVVSIGTGIVTVSLMKQMPSSVPQTINNVIQRTIEKVTTVQVPAPTSDTNNKENDVIVPKEDSVSLFGNNSDALVSIYLSSTDVTKIISPTEDTNESIISDGVSNKDLDVGHGIIISDIGLILVDSNIIKEDESYKVLLNKLEFDVSILKKFDNGFTILKISPKKDKTIENTDPSTITQ